MYKLLTAVVTMTMLSCSGTGNYEVIETFENGNPKIRTLELANEGGAVLHEELYENGQVKITGKMRDNKRFGQWKAFYEDGEVWSIGDYKNGERHGISKVFKPNGKPMMSGYFKDGKVDGTWATFTENGDTSQVSIYESGKLIRSYDKTVLTPVK